MKTVSNIKRSQARATSCGTVALLAADPTDQQATGKPPRFEMVLYTGATFANSWRWGDVILDVSGFKPHRQDLAAMLRHTSSQTVGWTESITSDPATATIRATGRLLEGDKEPLAAMVAGRLAQGFPYQCSGSWLPTKIETVMEKATAEVNGKTVTGPCTIFREFSILEASFAETGWDPMTSAIAASADADAPVHIQIIGGEQNMPDPTPNVGLLASLKDIVGADKAIALVTAKPDAKDLSAFAAELGAEVRTLNASLKTANETITAHAAKITTLETDLAAARKAPVIKTMAGDPSEPAATVQAGSPEAWKADYAKKPELRAEFPTVEQYVFFMQREAAKSKGA